MKPNQYAAFALGLVLCTAAFARSNNFGVGLMLGEPTALNAKLWLGETKALNFAMGWRYWGPYYNRGDCGYSDTRCYDNSFYNNNRGYCNSCYSCDPYSPGYRWRSVHLHVDFLVHNFSLISSPERFALYYGGGMLVNFGGSYYYDQTFHDFLIGIRGPLGITWLHRNSTFDIFAELAPAILVAPYFDLILNGGLGGRYYF
ncbi:MAG: hypothetical protein JW768_10280 [Chitinispirillaceae bacterium]|nr:hypothetical protein [Chitinispirillaceae bacterium]